MYGLVADICSILQVAADDRSNLCLPVGEVHDNGLTYLFLKVFLDELDDWGLSRTIQPLQHDKFTPSLHLSI